MKHIKIFEEQKPKFKTGDIVFILDEPHKRTKFKVENVNYNRVYLLDAWGNKCGWIDENHIDHVPEYEIDAEKYNI